MANILQDIWIMTEHGTVVYSRVYDEKVKSDLFGMLMSALNTFAEEISEGGLSSFDLSNKRFSILKQNNYIFLANSDTKVKKKKVLTELTEIMNHFFKTYTKEILEHFDGNVSLFDDFSLRIEKSLDCKTESFLSGI